MKFRDLYLDEVYKNIDQYKIEALKKISMERFDEVQVGCDPEITGKKRKREKLFKLHSNMLKYYQMASPGRVMIALVILSLFIVYVIPQICYTFAAFDRHHFGYFHDLEPIYAVTTANQKYYSENNIPYVTSADIKKEYEKIAFNRSLGLATHYEINHKQHYTFSNGVKKIYNKMPTMTIPAGLRRRLQDDKAPDAGAKEGDASTNATAEEGGAPPEDDVAVEKKQFEALFPTPFMTKEQI